MNGSTSTSEPTNQYVATITAKEMEGGGERAPVDISVAMDVSGSMQTNGKLELCKKTLLVLISELRPTDRFGLVAFSDSANEVFPLSFLTPSAKSDLINKVKKLSTTGCTNISGGLGMCVNSLTSVPSFEVSSVRSVLLLTDGHANRGIHEPSKLLNLVKGMIPTTENISINTFGYGDDHNEELMKSISETPLNQGSYYYVETEDNVSSAFGDCLGGLLSVAAQNIKLTISVPSTCDGYEGVWNMKVLNPDAVKDPDNTNTYMVKMGDIFAEESKDFLINLNYRTSCASDLILTATLEYLDIGTSSLVSSEVVEIKTAFVEGTEEVEGPDKYVVLQGLRVRVYENLEKANASARSSGTVDIAKAMVTDTLAYIQSTTSRLSLTPSENASVAFYASDLNDCISSLRSYSEYSRHGSKMMMMKMQSHARQRCNESNEDTMNAYRGSSKKGYASKMKAKMSFFKLGTG